MKSLLYIIINISLLLLFLQYSQNSQVTSIIIDTLSPHSSHSSSPSPFNNDDDDNDNSTYLLIPTNVININHMDYNYGNFSWTEVNKFKKMIKLSEIGFYFITSFNLMGTIAVILSCTSRLNQKKYNGEAMTLKIPMYIAVTELASLSVNLINMVKSPYYRIKRFLIH